MKSKQRALHADVGEAIEQAYDGRLEEVADTLAHHYDLTDRRDKAIRYLTMAGCKSLQVFFLDEADRRFARAVELVEADAYEFDNESFAKILASWLEVQFWRANFRSIIGIVEPRLDRVERLRENGHVAQILAFLGLAYVHQARFDDHYPCIHQ